MNTIFFLAIFYCLVASIFSTGCASIQTAPAYALKTPDEYKKGIYHKIKKGQTLWRIAKTYERSLDDVIRANNIPNAAKLEENQLVFIPGATQVKEIILDMPSNQNDFIWPLQGKVVKYFREYEGQRVNQGIDIEAPVGETIKAARSGRVVLVDYLSGYGPTVILDHEDGFYSIYSSPNEPSVKLGGLVVKGDSLFKGESDNEVAYLHFQIRKNSVEDNPLYYLP